MATNLTLGAMLRAGALGDGIKMIRQGFSMDAILKLWEQDYPTAPADVRRAAYNFCLRCVAAADALVSLPAGQTLKPRSYPVLPQ